MNKVYFALLFVAISWEGKAQISPPGLGTAHTAEWLAIGIRQPLNNRNTWQLVSYVGMGRKSAPNNYDPALKPAILVFNEEAYHTINEHWQYSFALSYRRQDEYKDVAPYEHQTPGVQQEFRAYGRLYYYVPLGRFKLAAIARQELRKFYTPDFNRPEENFQFRSRWRLQASMALGEEKKQKLIASAEALFATSHQSETNQWTSFEYEESRFSFYYSFTLPRLPLTVDLGYMNNLLGTQHPTMVHYLAVDFILENPFHI